jgi:hypothetical protein
MCMNVLVFIIVMLDFILSLTAVDSTYVPNGPLVKCSFL